MTMLVNKEPTPTPQKPVDQFREELSVYQYFYGKRARPKVFIERRDVMNILDCDVLTAEGYLIAVRYLFGKKEDDRVKVSEFCKYTMIDDLLIQLFLLSLPEPTEDNGLATWPEDVNPNDPNIEYGVWCVIGNMRYGSPVTELILQQRAKLWFDMHPPDPRGTPMYKREDGYRVTIFTHDIERVLNVSERTAQRLLQQTREELKKKKGAYVTVEEFCFHHDLNESIIRKKLDEIYNYKNGKDKDDSSK
jgi:hypothetical protein